ncbi:S phase cyclin A-associated protein in the endoplasmic reticulum [Prorops nasuta]|uniref:S phase cyclin A-associated protein in the endoplasmic reticulum n=1 Tax=Prorops nasuta TaxID=863751 RepID=UPI0034CFFE23
MADVRLLLQEEGRSARNLVAFNVPVGTNTTEKITRKPPSVPRIVHSSSSKRTMQKMTRVRSASTGRDKKSELQARYWAFLFGNLQRAVDAIYQTCEEDENISECKEVILVLENFTRDFHNLIEWFKVKWAYENSPPPLRRTPLAWEVRKTSPCRMWNSNVIPKSSSPLQRISPTESICRSPTDSLPSENRSVLSDKINRVKEEPVHKIAKENRNYISKDNSSNSRERQIREIDKGSNSVAGSKSVNKSNLKQSISAKSNINSTVANRISDTNCCDTRNRLNVKNNTKQMKSNQQATNSKKNTDRSTESVCNKTNNIESVKDIEAVRNEINTKVSQQSKKENTGKNSNIKIKKRIDIIINDGSENRTAPKALTSASSSISINKTSNTAISRSCSAVSRSRSSRMQERNPLEAPKFIRSKTTLCDKKVLNVNKTRPGTSVIVRRPFQPLDNEKSEENILKKEYNKDINGSVEVLTKQTKKTREDDDGWQTVRSRYRRGSSHNLNMSTRFHKPSTATSLPALSIESPAEKGKKNCLTPDGNQRSKKKFLEGKAGKNINNEVEKVIGQTSFGDSIKNECGDFLKSALTLNDTNSTSVIAAIFKNDAELLEKRIQQFMAAQAERERIILEEERKTEEADSQRSQQLSDEEAFLTKQILELESTDIDIDTETDETDGEMILEIEDEPVESLSVVSDDISLEDRYENMLEGMSWAERVDTLAQLQALVARHPGRALELHQKLSSPSRKRSLPETLRRYQTKQACAQHKRQKLLMEKSQRLRELLNKVEDVKSAKNQLIEDKRVRMEMKLKRAEENRTQHLLEIVRKAHDEDSKLKEIAFINELEAQNKRHDFMALCQEQEERLQGIHEERQRRQEEKAAKEAAAEERRKVLEAERLLRIQKMRQARREREERVGKMQLEREKERQELAREKARDREERLSALHAAQLANQEELQKKIAQKQQESARRHVENIEHIRQRAVESSILKSEEVPPTLKSYPAPKQCSLCSVLIPNEVYLLSHLKGKLHLTAIRNAHDGREPSRDELQRFNISQICDMASTINTTDNKAAKEKQKALKRRCRKIKQRMALRGEEYKESIKNDIPLNIESPNKTKFRRNLKELDRLYNSHMKNTWASVAVAALERCLGEITRTFAKSCPNDQDVFRSLNGFETLTNLFNLCLNAQNSSCNLPNKPIISLCKAFKASINGHKANIETILLSNQNFAIVDLLLQRLEALTNLDDQSQILESTGNSSGCGVVATGALQLLCSLIPEEPFEKSVLSGRIQDISAYLVAGGLVDRVSRHARALIETEFFVDQERESPLIIACYDLLARICRHLKRSVVQENSGSHGDAGTGEQTTVECHLLSSLTLNEAAGSIGTLYTAIALFPQNQKAASPTPNQASVTSSVKNLASKGLALLRAIAELDLNRLQNLLGAEGTNLQWRLLASHLITRLTRDPLPNKPEIGAPSSVSVQILCELFAVLGYFAINNPENQLILQSAGAGPSVLQQLCTLPFPFYGDPALSSYTLPALLAATHHNPEAISVLSCELSYQLLEEYKKSEEGKQNPLVRLLKDTPSPPHTDPLVEKV